MALLDQQENKTVFIENAVKFYVENKELVERDVCINMLKECQLDKHALQQKLQDRERRTMKELVTTEEPLVFPQSLREIIAREKEEERIKQAEIDRALEAKRKKETEKDAKTSNTGNTS